MPDLLLALNAGLPGMCTLHANSARESLVKMCGCLDTTCMDCVQNAHHSQREAHLSEPIASWMAKALSQAGT